MMFQSLAPVARKIACARNFGRPLLAGASVLALTAMFAPAAQADAHFIALGNPFWNLASPAPWDGIYPGAGDRAIFDRAGTGAVANLIANRNVGQLVYMAPYTGPGFVSLTPPVIEGPITLMGLPGLAAGDPVLGVDDQVDQEIDLFDKMAVGGNQEWRISSALGSIRQLNVVAGRGLNLNSFMLTLNPVNAANTFLLDDVISGTGGIIVTGAGTVTMTMPNTYSGGTSLNGGILSVSADNNLGATSGGLNFNGGTLQVTGTTFHGAARAITWGGKGGGFDIADAANNFTLSQTLSDTGPLAKLGAGTLTLASANSYTGLTTISVGTLALSGTGSIASSSVRDDGAFDISGTAAGAPIVSLSGGGTVVLGAQTLVLTAAADSFGGAIHGTGGLTLTGGSEMLTGISSYSGPTRVSGGSLSVNGSIASSPVTVESGARLGGNGTVGATTIQSGGTIAPGNSIGTLHVNGPLVQDAGSVYQVEVDPSSNASDLILVNGTATIANGASLTVTKNPAGDYHTGAHYTVLTASGGVNGSYDISGATAISQYLALEQQQDANNVYLAVVQTGDPAAAAQTGNQQATADGLPNGNGVTTGVLNSQSGADARDAFDKLSGEALASARGALVSGSLLVRDTALDRLRDICSADDIANHPGCLDRERPLVWVQGFGNWGHIGGNGNAASLSHTTGGFLIGTDVPVYDWRVGVFGGYSRTDFHVDARSSWGSSDNYHLGAYGGTSWDDVAIRLGASYSWNDLATERQVAFGNFSNDLHASYNAGTAQIFSEVGQAFAFNRLTVEPFANLSYANLRTYAFREGSGDAALSSAANTQEDTFTTLGLRPSTEFTIASLSLRAKGMFGWRHTFGTVTPNATVAFAGGDSFTVTGAPIARDAGVVEVGLSTSITEAAAINLTYGAQFGGRESNNGVRGTVAIAF